MKMKARSVYVDLDGNAICLDGLDALERRLLGRLERRARTHPDWSDFGNYWMSAVAEFYDERGLSRAQTIKKAIYQIAQDLSGRLGIAQGMIRPVDYLDQLEDLVLNHFPSRRAFLQSKRACRRPSQRRPVGPERLAAGKPEQGPRSDWLPPAHRGHRGAGEANGLDGGGIPKGFF
jgi:hypothetical protein